MHNNSSAALVDGGELLARKDWDLEFATLLIGVCREQRIPNDEIINIVNGKSARQDAHIIKALREAIGLRLDVARMKAHIARLLTY